MEALSYCQLMERCLAAEARVVELESRTVKLPKPFELAGLSSRSSYYHADGVDAALIAADIKVEAQ